MTPRQPSCSILSALICLMLTAPPMAAQELGRPLSAIDWLDDALSHPLTDPGLTDSGLTDSGLTDSGAADVQPYQGAPPDEPISVITLGKPLLDQIGLFPPERIGIPRDFWAETPVTEILTGLAALPADTAPSALQLTFRLMLAELAPPAQIPVDLQGTILTARIDKLIAMGALEPAAQLLDAAPVQTAALNARAFDIALLLGEEDHACSRMEGQIPSAFGRSAQIFCMARRGDWQSAFTMLQVSKALGLLEPVDAALLLRFLEEEEEQLLPPPPAELSPLGWRILEALGDPVPTATLPVAYAYADLRGTSGWRAQLDAAERLTRAGVMQPNRLLGLYAQRRPAASGGVWERVRAVQRLDQALSAGDSAGDSAGAAAALEGIWPLFVSVELETALAQMFTDPLIDSGLTLTGPARTIMWQMLLLAQTGADHLAALAPDTTTGRLATALALDQPLPAPQGSDMAAAVAAAFHEQPQPASADNLPLPDHAPAARFFDAMAQIAQAMAGDPRAAQIGLQQLRLLGLTEAARQIGIELLLLERRG